MVLAGRQSKVSHALDVQLVPGVAQVPRLKELHLVGDGACAEILVGRVLQVPASLRLLHKLANDCTLSALGLIRHSRPDLQVLLGIAFLVLGRQLPCEDVGAQRGEAELEDVEGGDGRDQVAGRGVDDRNPGQSCQPNRSCRVRGSLLFGRRPGKIPAVRRVAFATKVAFGPGDCVSQLSCEHVQHRLTV